MEKNFTLYGLEKKTFKNSNGNEIAYYSAFGVFAGIEQNCYISLRLDSEDTYKLLVDEIKKKHFVEIIIDIDMSVYNFKLTYKYNYKRKEK